MAEVKKLIALFAIVLSTLTFADTANSAPRVTTNPKLDEIASRIAGQPVHVWCYADEEIVDDGHKDPYGYLGAWGYVWLWDTTVNLSRMVCDGLEAVMNHDDDEPTTQWEKGLGALVLSHESYHLALRYGASRGDEAETECRAVRHVKYVLQMLGATPVELREQMYGALAAHWRLVRRFPQYNLASCKVPRW